MRRKGERLSALLLSGYFWLIVVYLLFPIAIVIPISFSSGQFLQFPPEELGFRWYDAYFGDEIWVSSTLLSLRVAVMASLLATVVGTMAVLFLERRAFRLKGLVMTAITSPIIIPHIFIALGVFILAVRLGVEDSTLVLAGAHATIALPFVVLIVGAAARQLDPTIERAARVLGAGPLRAFFAATFPSLLPAIVAAAVFAFFVSFDELIIAEFLLSGQETLPMRIWADLRLEVSPTVAAVSTLLVVVTSLAMVGAEILRRRSAAQRDKENTP
ncbi:MAG: ABC transporter permease [Pseudomonadota bacterium]